MISTLLLRQAVGTPRATVTLSGEDLDNVGDEGNSVGIRFGIDGTVDKLINGLVDSQLDAATDWGRPVGAIKNGIGGRYSVRYTTLVGDAFTTEAAAEDTWIAISANRDYILDPPGAPGNDSNSVTFEIRDNAGTVTLNTAAYTFSATEPS